MILLIVDWISPWNFAAILIAELVPLRLLECLLKCLEMGVNPFPLEIILSQAHSQFSVRGS